MKKLMGILTTLLLVAMLFPVGVAADSRCNGGYGVTFYEDLNYKNSKITFCQALAPSNGLSVPNLTAWTTDLGHFETWNDRVTSYQVFNTVGSKTIKFYSAANYGGVALTQTGNGKVPDLRIYYQQTFSDGFSDQISSFKLQ